jgi:hypothetical protein
VRDRSSRLGESQGQVSELTRLLEDRRDEIASITRERYVLEVRTSCLRGMPVLSITSWCSFLGEIDIGKNEASKIILPIMCMQFLPVFAGD